ncbi:MAG TPA: Fe-Mn family superoxide dismutase [Candidatus Binatia bacterium]|jgi:Fe-Mn family superoxide dismutase|nr:Fe-Mn family superoxide dismutase [Candidatus Binatia bacterium]
MSAPQPYKAVKFPLSGLRGISDKTLEMHFKLYEGYVTQTNLLNERIAGIIGDGKIDQEETPAYSELTRRLGFEYNGMVLHEYYFGNLRTQGDVEPPAASTFRAACASRYGSYENWKTDFVGVGKMRGVGWAVCFLDPITKRISNHWITLHEVGGVVGFEPLLVMDVWEHAFLLDYPPSERAKYIDAFFQNVDWQVVDHRLAGGGTTSRTE